jgi:enamine deaminase RidA (YjgF/YER057c/UK114 family)
VLHADELYRYFNDIRVRSFVLAGAPTNQSLRSRGRFSEVVTVTGSGKLIFLAGTGPEEEMDGAILHKDDFIEQCRHAYGKVKKMLALHGATMRSTFALSFAWPFRIAPSFPARLAELAR